MADGINFTIIDNSGEFIRAKDEAVIRTLESVGLFLEGEASDELENEPRRVDTGRLKGSITHYPVTGPEVIVGTDVNYAIWVIQKPTKEQAA